MAEDKIDLNSLEPCAKWTDDCQGKKDYDGLLLVISTRYYPSPYQENRLKSAHVAINIEHGEPDDNGYGQYIEVVKAHFENDTEAAVKQRVENWVKLRFQEIAKLLTDFYETDLSSKAQDGTFGASSVGVSETVVEQPVIALHVRRKAIMPDGSLGCVSIGEFGGDRSKDLQLTVAQARTVIRELTAKLDAAGL